MQALFDTIRDACGPGIWSRGIELARQEAVEGESASDEMIVVRVTTRGGLLAPRVQLFPDDEEWDCDCDGNDDPCDHVAAAVIALRQARQAGNALPVSSRPTARIGYRLTRRSGGLHFDRVAVIEEREVPLEGSLVAIAAGKIDGPDFAASEADRKLENFLGSRLSGVFPHTALPQLLRALRACDDVRLDGEKVSLSLEPVGAVGVVEDRGDGFALSVMRDPAITEVFGNGVALCGEVLRPLADARISQREREHWLEGEYFSPDRAALLVAEVIPRLQERIPVEVRSERLPRTTRVPPRLLVDVGREADSLTVEAQIVYGDPPGARIESGELIALQGPVPLRDEVAEGRLQRTLRKELGLSPGQGVQLHDREAIEFAQRLREFSGELRGDAHRDYFESADLEVRLSSDPGSFDLEFVPDGATANRVSSSAVMEAWQAGRAMVALEAGGFAPLPVDWLERYGRQVADLLAARDASGSLANSALPDLARLCAELELPPPPGLEGLRALLEDFDGLPEASLPTDLHAELRGYQTLGVNWLMFLRQAGLGGLLADDMGLGKTLQALCAIQGRSLVVAPTSVLFGWAEQARMFRPDLKICMYHGPGRELDPDADLTLTSYALLRLDIDALAAVSWNTAILDEAQAIKNPSGQVARAAYRLRADFRVTLTGTPVENRLEELWSQLHFLNPGMLGTREDFRRRYARPIAAAEPGAAAHLRSRIRPFVLRRLKRDVAPELPPRTEVVLHCELDESERAVYDGARAATRDDVIAKLNAGGGVIQALEALLRLRQAACHSGLVPGQEAAGSSKIEVLLRALEEATSEGHKALVFSQWTGLLDRVEPHLRQQDIAFTRLDGSTRDRAGVVESFQSKDGPPVLLISLRAGGTGLNLTAADHVFLLDPWWNPAVEAQAADRAHRIGQENPVSVFRLVARNTVEERILALQSHKRGLAEAALGAADRTASITRDELLALLD